MSQSEASSITAIIKRLRFLESNTRAEVAGGVTSVLFAALPTVSATSPGRILYVSNGLKPGEAPGAGTGVLAVDDSIAWRRVGDYTTVAA